MSHVLEHDLPLWAACRRTDPVPSRIAAGMAGELRAEHQRKIVEALKVSPAGASGIAERVGLVAHQVGKRLGELERVGVIEQTGRMVMSAARRPEREWRLRG